MSTCSSALTGILPLNAFGPGADRTFCVKGQSLSPAVVCGLILVQNTDWQC